MEAEKEIMDFLRKNLSEKRFRHSVSVSHTAEQLAGLYGCDMEKAAVAGLLHDCAREKKKDKLVEYANKAGIRIDAVTMEMEELLHGPAAVYLCQKEFNLYDEEILSAIRYHTTGRENMEPLEKIIFLADFIEPSRDYPGIEKLRRLAFEDLNEALIEACDTSIRYVISKRGIIHPDTVLARNYLVRENKGHTERDSLI